MIRDILNGLKSTFGNRRSLRKLRLSQSGRRRCHFELLESRQVLAAPGSPSLSAAIPGNGQVSLVWTAPTFPSDSTIVDYLVQYTRDSLKYQWSTFVEGTSTSTTAIVTGLVDGEEYWFRVAAVTSTGTGLFSNVQQSQPSSWAWATGSKGSGLVYPASLAFSTPGPAIATCTDGSSIVAGSFWGSVSFGGINYTSHNLPDGYNYNDGDLFVAKFKPDGSWAWVVHASATNHEACFATSVSALADGGAIVAGGFSGTVTFGNTSLSCTDGATFVAKLNPDGSWAWAARAGNGGYDSKFKIISSLADGSAIVTGSFSQTTSYGITTLSGTLLPTPGATPSFAANAFVAKIAPDGAFAWVTPVASWNWAADDLRNTGGCFIQDAATFPDGSTALIGMFGSNGTTSLGNTTFSRTDDEVGIVSVDIFYAKFNAVGAFVWAKQAGLVGSILRNGYGFDGHIAAMADETAVVSGSFFGTARFGSTQLVAFDRSSVTAPFATDIFVAKLNTDGSYAWATRGGGEGSDNCYEIGKLPDGSIVLLTAVGNSTVFGNLNPLLRFDWLGGTYLVKLSPDGVYQWRDKMHTRISSDRLTPSGIATFDDGSVGVTGTFKDDAFFGAINLKSDPRSLYEALFIAKSKLDGTVFATIPPPINVKASAGDSEVSLAWTAPPSAGATKIADYVIQYSGDNGLSWTTFGDGVSTSTTTTVKGLKNGTGYRLRVSAVDSQNVKSSWAYSPTVTPVAVPGPPTAVAGTIGDMQVILSWTAPLTNGGAPIKDYLIQYSSDGGLNWTTVNDATETATTTTVGGLLNGTSYVFRVAAVNDIGTGAYSLPSATVTPAAVPGPPIAVTGTIGNTQVVLSWVVPVSDGGMPIKDYLIQYSSDAGLNWTRVNDATETAATTRVGGLLNGTSYVFRVAAVNDNGTGIYSRPSLPLVPMTPINVPGVLAAPSAVVNGDMAVVWWERPSTNGNSPIVNYVLEYSDNNGQTWTIVPRNESIATSWVLVNLVADATYVFRVAAVNRAGPGLPSVQSSPIARGAAMPVPMNLAVTAGNGCASLSWTFPSTNGRAVDGYIVQYSSDVGRNWTTYQYGGGVVAQNTLVVGGLLTRSTYVFRVAALGRGERSDWSQISRSVVPVPLAAAPIRVLGRAIVNRISRDGAVYLAWTPARNAGNSRILGYQIQYSTGLNSSWSTVTNILLAGTRATIRGLTGGIPYTFRVAAITREGVGPFSVASSRISPFVSPVPQRR